jgi:hypothetical protein
MSFASTLLHSAKFQLNDEWRRVIVPSFVKVLDDEFLALWRTERGGETFLGLSDIFYGAFRRNKCPTIFMCV